MGPFECFGRQNELVAEAEGGSAVGIESGSQPADSRIVDNSCFDDTWSQKTVDDEALTSDLEHSEFDDRIRDVKRRWSTAGIGRGKELTAEEDRRAVAAVYNREDRGRVRRDTDMGHRVVLILRTDAPADRLGRSSEFPFLAVRVF